VDGDGKADLVVYAAYDVWATFSNGRTLSAKIKIANGYGRSQTWGNNDYHVRGIGDFNNDGKMDVIGYSCCNVSNTISMGR